ncbi:hypothetical protein MMC13_001879 [Lambiella insularis]|nr:hypothetical protein [Lambiella insularis]
MHFPTHRKPGDFEHIETEPDDPRLNRQHYEATKITPSVDIGMPYPGCTQNDLRELDHHSHHWRSQWHPRPIRQATEELCAFLKKPPTKNVQAAIDRLNAAWNSEKWSPEIAMKCFHDLDKVYFGGFLKGKTKLRWKGSTQALYEVLGPTYKGTFGVTCSAKDSAGAPAPLAKIILNAQKIFLDPMAEWSRKRATFGTLLHEMHIWESGRAIPVIGKKTHEVLTVVMADPFRHVAGLSQNGRRKTSNMKYSGTRSTWELAMDYLGIDLMADILPDETNTSSISGSDRHRSLG